MRALIGLMVMLWAQGLTAQQVDHVTAEERLALVRIVDYLDDIEGLIDRASHAQDPDTRFPVHYQALQADIETIKSALVEHLDRPSRSPKVIVPLELEVTSNSAHSVKPMVEGQP